MGAFLAYLLYALGAGSGAGAAAGAGAGATAAGVGAGAAGAGAGAAGAASTLGEAAAASAIPASLASVAPAAVGSTAAGLGADLIPSAATTVLPGAITGAAQYANMLNGITSAASGGGKGSLNIDNAKGFGLPSAEDPLALGGPFGTPPGQAIRSSVPPSMKAGVTMPANVRPGPATYSQGTGGMNTTPVIDPVLASQPKTAWDHVTNAIGDVWHGYQNLELGPGADKLTPEQRSQAFWGAKLQQVATALGGGNGPQARLAYGQHFIRQNDMNSYLDKAEAQATTPEEKMRVAEMRAFHVPIKASTPLRPKAPVMRAISDTQEAAFDPDTGAQVGPAVARFKASSGGPKDERMAEEIQAARDKVLSAAQTDDLTSLARLDPTALPKANRMKPGESRGDFAAWNARLRDLQNPPAPPEASAAMPKSDSGFNFDSLSNWLKARAAMGMR